MSFHLYLNPSNTILDLHASTGALLEMLTIFLVNMIVWLIYYVVVITWEVRAAQLFLTAFNHHRDRYLHEQVRICYDETTNLLLKPRVKAKHIDVFLFWD